MIEMIWQCTLIVSSVADPGPEKIRYGSVSESRPNFDMDPDLKRSYPMFCVRILLNYHFSIKNNLN